MYDDVYKTRRGFLVPSEHIPSEDDMQRYSTGDKSIIPELIEGMTGCVVNDIEWFLQCSERAQPFREDCISEALFALTEFVHGNLGKVFNAVKFQNYARRECKNRVTDWLRENSIAVTIPVRTQQTNNIQLQQEKLDDRIGHTKPDSVFDEVWFEHFMDTLNEADRKLVQMKIEGLSEREIGRRLGMESRTVRRHFTRLLTQYEGNQ